VFRQREDLAEHIAVTVTYLGGSSDSLTLNFSRPASGPYVQFYKLLRLGKEGYMKKVENQMAVAAFLRKFIASLVHPSGQKRFQILDGGDVSENCLIYKYLYLISNLLLMSIPLDLLLASCLRET
jgi:glutamate decarboxylase